MKLTWKTLCYILLHVPKCKVVETKLKQSGLEFTLVEDVDKTVSIGEKVGITSAPILEVDGNYYDFSEAIKYLKELVK